MVNRGPLDIRLVGVCPDGSDQLYDASGKKLETSLTLPGPWRTHWEDDKQQRDFFFGIPDINDQLTFLPFPRIFPAGTKNGLGGGFGGFYDPIRSPSTLIQSIAFNRTCRAQVAHFFQAETAVKYVDFTLRYFYGPRRHADYTFTGPFAMNRIVNADGGRPGSLTFQEAFTSDSSGIELRFTTTDPFDGDTPAFMYDQSGRRYMLDSHSGRSGSRGANRHRQRGMACAPGI
jgi:hypothetical protein